MANGIYRTPYTVYLYKTVAMRQSRGGRITQLFVFPHQAHGVGWRVGQTPASLSFWSSIQMISRFSGIHIAAKVFSAGLATMATSADIRKGGIEVYVIMLLVLVGRCVEALWVAGLTRRTNVFTALDWQTASRLKAPSGEGREDSLA